MATTSPVAEALLPRDLGPAGEGVGELGGGGRCSGTMTFTGRVLDGSTRKGFIEAVFSSRIELWG